MDDRRRDAGISKVPAAMEVARGASAVMEKSAKVYVHYDDADSCSAGPRERASGLCSQIGNAVGADLPSLFKLFTNESPQWRGSVDNMYNIEEIKLPTESSKARTGR